MQNYEEYAKMIESTTELFNKECVRVADVATEIMQNRRLSEFGQKDAKNKEYERLNAAGENMTKVMKEAVMRFCNDYSITVPFDGKDHSQDISNALRVVDMLGEKIDERNLANIMEPLKTDYKSMKYVLDVLDQKTKAGLYPSAITRAVLEYMGINDTVMEYLDGLETLKMIINGDYGYKFTLNSLSLATTITLQPQVSYEVLALPDTIRSLGAQYEKIESDFGGLYTRRQTA